MITENVDVLIIGAGPSGCVSAAYLHKKGFSVQVVEKSKFPRFVIGESLLPRSMEHFKEVDLFDCLNAMNFEKKRGARFIRGTEVCLFDFSKKYTEGWNWTWQVPRADFDKALADEIIKKGVNIAFEWAVTAVDFDGTHSKTTIQNDNGAEKAINAKFIIDSSGYGRVLPRLLDLDKPSTLPKHSSIFTHVEDINRPEGTEGTLITFDIVKPQVWLWVIPFSNGKTSIGIVGPTEFMESYQGNTSEMFREMLKLSTHYYDRFKDVDFEFDPICIKNYSKSVKQLYGDGYALTGNSSEFLDPVFSSGVAFATESSLLAAKLVARQLNGEKVDWENEYTNYIKRGVNVFSTYVKEWYTENLQTLFFHRPENPEVKEKICAVLAGYVWDETNPFVKKHDRAISSMAHLLKMES
ncbi:NAD(P)/FAD-dependent oxidoreductase [Aureibaculum sp. 2210JD6-5]|uniref:NAD(P)/FAD-dependent oxidoreductase n=1 Tax=Aureibaculum sp. 2210JD6-5 TaxID=3103957 RepID=UPI002AAF08C9|nr:NAD(P)/FAD-dependent oxidoreductase [Aureibaculum sp. 2210JD6-5]MDY7393902.1 NAD(P)/FAD-dependent oxidoreductase [Aureibaculum sp. 2210JD6-5]